LIVEEQVKKKEVVEIKQMEVKQEYDKLLFYYE
jgi:hypothetical protein